MAIQDAILVVTYFQRLREVEQHGIEQAAREAAEKRFRPGADDDARSAPGSIGSQTQKPLAIVVIGGSLILPILTRVLQPRLLILAHTWPERRQARDATHAAVT